MVYDVLLGILIVVLGTAILGVIGFTGKITLKYIRRCYENQKKPHINRAIFKTSKIWKKEFPRESKLLVDLSFFENHFYKELVRLLYGEEAEIAILCEKLREGVGYAPGIDAELMVRRFIEIFYAIAEASQLIMEKPDESLPSPEKSRSFPAITDTIAPLKKEYAIIYHDTDEELVWKFGKHLDSNATLITCSGTLSEVKNRGFSRAKRLIIFPSDKFLVELGVKKDQWWDLVENSEEYRQGNVIIVLASTIKEHPGFSYPSDALRIIHEVESGDIDLALEKFILLLKR